VYEVGRCQLDLLVHVITGRLSLTKPALNLGFRAESRRYRLRSDSAFPPRGRFAVPTTRNGAMPQFPRSSRGELEVQRNCRGRVPPRSDRIPVQWLQKRAEGGTRRGVRAEYVEVAGFGSPIFTRATVMCTRPGRPPPASRAGLRGALSAARRDDGPSV
jgi:hypothetical protein